MHKQPSHARSQSRTIRGIAQTPIGNPSSTDAPCTDDRALRANHQLFVQSNNARARRACTIPLRAH
eukprot:6586351-Lingulodinium_polyedra.AAC.1